MRAICRFSKKNQSVTGSASMRTEVFCCLQKCANRCRPANTSAATRPASSCWVPSLTRRALRSLTESSRGMKCAVGRKALLRSSSRSPAARTTHGLHHSALVEHTSLSAGELKLVKIFKKTNKLSKYFGIARNLIFKSKILYFDF